MENKNAIGRESNSSLELDFSGLRDCWRKF